MSVIGAVFNNHLRGPIPTDSHDINEAIWRNVGRNIDPKGSAEERLVSVLKSMDENVLEQFRLHYTPRAYDFENARLAMLRAVLKDMTSLHILTEENRGPFMGLSKRSIKYLKPNGQYFPDTKFPEWVTDEKMGRLITMDPSMFEDVLKAASTSHAINYDYEVYRAEMPPSPVSIQRLSVVAEIDINNRSYTFKATLDAMQRWVGTLKSMIHFSFVRGDSSSVVGDGMLMEEDSENIISLIAALKTLENLKTVEMSVAWNSTAENHLVPLLAGMEGACLTLFLFRSIEPTQTQFDLQKMKALWLISEFHLHAHSIGVIFLLQKLEMIILALLKSAINAVHLRLPFLTRSILNVINQMPNLQTLHFGSEQQCNFEGIQNIDRVNYMVDDQDILVESKSLRLIVIEDDGHHFDQKSAEVIQPRVRTSSEATIETSLPRTLTEAMYTPAGSTPPLHTVFVNEEGFVDVKTSDGVSMRIPRRAAVNSKLDTEEFKDEQHPLPNITKAQLDDFLEVEAVVASIVHSAMEKEKNQTEEEKRLEEDKVRAKINDELSSMDKMKVYNAWGCAFFLDNARLEQIFRKSLAQELSKISQKDGFAMLQPDFDPKLLDDSKDPVDYVGPRKQTYFPDDLEYTPTSPTYRPNSTPSSPANKKTRFFGWRM